MTVQAPDTPATQTADPAVPPADPAGTPDSPAAPRVPAGQPDGGQFAPPSQADSPAAPVTTPAPAEPDWKAQAEAARAETERLRAETATAKAEHDRIRAEADRWKAQSRQQEARSKANHSEVRVLTDVVRELAVKAGVEFDDKPNPEEVSRRLGEMTAQARRLTVERAVYLNAAKAGADPVTLLDSREFIARAEQVDPDAPDFDFQVADLVREAAKESRFQLPAAPAPPAPSLTPQVTQAPAQQQPAAQFTQPPAQPPAASSGADFSGAPGGNRLWTQADYDYWTTSGRDRDGEVMAKAIENGLLVNLGIGKPKRKTYR